MKRDFGGVIWTNHALERLQERGIAQGDAWATFNRPDQSRKGSNKAGSWVYYKTYNVPLKDFPDSVGQKIEVVAKKNEEGKWIILSVWARPVYKSRKEYKSNKAGKKKDSPLVHFVKWIFNKHDKS